jgi:hypothetical protein
VGLLATPDQPTRPTPQLATLYTAVGPCLAVADLQLRAETNSWMGIQELAPSVMERIKETESPQVIVDVHSRGLIRRRRAGHEARWQPRSGGLPVE